MLFDLEPYCGKTSQEFSRRATIPSAACWANLSALVAPSHVVGHGRTRVWSMDQRDERAGVSWMPNTSAWPNDANVCSLSSVLEPPESIPQKYFLSGKACAGILRRAESRGKKLPGPLALALQGGGSGLNSMADSSSDAMEATTPAAQSKSLQPPTPGGGVGRIDFETETFVVHGSQDPIIGEDCAHAVGRNNGAENVLAFKASHYTRDKDGAPSEISPPCSADADRGDQDTLIYVAASGVRRFTPRETERLQGYGKSAADSPRYRAIGNSMAIPVVRWIGQRIADSIK